MTYADDLRRLAEFYDANPELPHPSQLTIWLASDVATKQLVEFSRMLPRPIMKYASDYCYGVTAHFGSIDLQVLAIREAVCTRREIGTKVIPAREEEVIPVYEWSCPESLRALDDGA